MTDDYQQLKNGLGFVEEKTIRVTEPGSNFVVSGKIGEKEVLLKVSPANKSSHIYRYKKEWAIETFISKAEKANSFTFPRTKVINYGIADNFAWITREFFKGEPLCDVSNSNKTPLLGYDILEKEFIDREQDLIPKIVDKLNLLKNISASEVLELPKTKRFGEHLIEENIEKIEKELGLSLEEAVGFYNQKEEDFFASKNLGPCIGDLVPPNILVDENNFVFSDFEWFSVDNYMTDIAFLWSFLWRYPRWQEAIIEAAIKTDEDKEMFRLAIIRQVINCQWHSRFINASNQEDTFMWYKYLVAAGKSFNELMKVKGEDGN